MTYVRSFIACLLVCALASCSGGDGSAEIKLSTDFVPGEEFSLVSVEHLTGTTVRGERYEAVAFHGEVFGAARTIARFAKVESGLQTFRVLLLRANGSQLAERQASVTVSGDTSLTIVASRDCASATSECAVDAGMNDASAIDAAVADAGSNDASTDDAGFDAGVDAGVDASADAGDTDDAGVDGGVMLDSGGPVDAGSLLCGRACSLADPCSAAVWDCTSGAPVCTRVGARPFGTVCGVDSSCNSAGDCMACRTGAVCHVGCDVGEIACESGVESCHIDSGSSPLSEGTACAVADVCVDGDTCTTSGVCSPAGVCVSCVEGSLCDSGDPCILATTTCGTGTPVCNVVGPRAPGASCGGGAICTFEGACALCVDGEVCAAATECGSSEWLYCAFGGLCAPLPAPMGATCSAGLCSGAGTCYAPLAADEIATGVTHVCALAASGHVLCWGSAEAGQLGDGPGSTTVSDKVDVGIDDAVAIAVGAHHSCAVDSSGDVWCWGDNSSQQVDGTSASDPAPRVVALPSPAIAVTCGERHTCALLADGHVYCWGANERHQLGDGTTTAGGPVQVHNLALAVQIDAGPSHSCARLANSHLACWGYGHEGALGDGRVIDLHEWLGANDGAVDVLDIGDAIDIDVAGERSCAVRASGELWCWGQATLAGSPWVGILEARAATLTRPYHVPLPFGGVVDVSSGANDICVRHASGALSCWGFGFTTESEGASMEFIVHDIPLAGALQQMSVSNNLRCAIRSTGEATCWGSGSNGELGDGMTNGSDVPILVRGL